MTRLSTWAVALVALGLTLWLAGPRAWAVLRRETGAQPATGPVVDAGRVAFRRCPSWLTGPLLLAVMADLEPRLRGEVALLDDGAARALAQRLRSSPWVADVALERAFPDRFVTRLTLRRPVLQIRSEADRPAALIAAGGICLPPVAGLDLPRALVRPRSAEPPLPWGRQHPDAEVTAAAAVAVEWREKVAAAVPEAPALAVVDCRNLGYRFVADGRWSEVLVGLRRADGQDVHLAYGHPPGSSLERVPVATKVRVLRAILQGHSGLDGLQGGDLRFGNRWRDWLLPRPDVAGGR